jgi:outer membrane protein assembly factor BamB
MSNPQNDQSTPNSAQPDPTPNTLHPTPNAPRKPIRLWPGVAAAVLLMLAWFILPKIAPEAILYGMLVSAVAILLLLVWWVFFSRLPWLERLGTLVLIVAAIFVTYRLIHISLAGGAMGFLFYVVSVPVICLALVAAIVITRQRSNAVRRAAIVVAILLACGGFTLLRTGGITGFAGSDWHWRWSKSPEDLLLAQQANEPMSPAPPSAISTVATTEAEWPGFRGPQRDGIVHSGAKIKTDWASSPPVELWRRSIGPGWSSFAVHGDLFYTQEQRGNDEVVSCYNMTTGKPVWRHSDAARFWESNAGTGPRATPTLYKGRVYTLGATGILNALDAATGAVVWSRNAASDTGAKLPGWGFSGSPLVINDSVIVATAGTLAAYDLATGAPRWIGPKSNGGYSSPHLVTIGGVPQVLLLGGLGATSLSPTDGKQLWNYTLSSNARIVQPAMTADGDVLVHDGETNGMRRLAVANGPNGWTVTERWMTEGLNPYFSDFVVHKGHAYGFDGSGIACINLDSGDRKWKGGAYGSGQLVLLPDQDVLLVLSELGDLALVAATPGQFKELARVPAIKGKTWNHPVLAGDKVLVRNGEEMAAFRLAGS